MVGILSPLICFHSTYLKNNIFRHICEKCYLLVYSSIGDNFVVGHALHYSRPLLLVVIYLAHDSNEILSFEIIVYYDLHVLVDSKKNASYFLQKF